ncbi:hypothetical protein L3Q82_002417 [Scortum barcoo]|uniref:Uncharacterized protein n=1 Tax=Scortum barcoo TaxID=214431 RepID=A0ACB8VYN2_9TELE|nr:hypothetical protein L3Q82_002417 [Scortum barcoo]
MTSARLDALPHQAHFSGHFRRTTTQLKKVGIVSLTPMLAQSLFSSQAQTMTMQHHESPEHQSGVSSGEGFPSLLCFILVCKQCVISVTLNSAQQCVFLVENSHHYIALSKSPSEEWRDLSPFALECNFICDWKPTGRAELFAANA